MKGLTSERVAEICKQVNPNKDWTDAEIEGLAEISSDPAFATEAVHNASSLRWRRIYKTNARLINCLILPYQ